MKNPRSIDAPWEEEVSGFVDKYGRKFHLAGLCGDEILVIYDGEKYAVLNRLTWEKLEHSKMWPHVTENPLT